MHSKQRTPENDNCNMEPLLQAQPKTEISSTLKTSKPMTAETSSPSWFSKIFFIWLYPILWRGWKDSSTLQTDISYNEVPKCDRAKDLVNRLEKAWNKQIATTKLKGNNDKPRFISALASTYGVQYALLGFTAFIEECVIRVGQPLCLGFLMQYFRGNFNETEGWCFAGGVVFLSMWYCTQHHPFFFALQHNGMKMRIATSALIYKKALRLSLQSLENTSQGKLINLMANDVNRLDLSKDFMHYIWIAPCQLGIVMFILWRYFRWVSFVGIGLLVLFIPFQSIMGRLFGKYRSDISVKTDTRLRYIGQVLKGISAIKMYAWETAFAAKVDQSRREEVKILRKTTLLRSMNQSLYYVACKIVIFVTLLVYFLTDNLLTPEKVFVTMALFNNIRMTLTLFLPFGISQFAEIRVALDRIQSFLLLDEFVNLNNLQRQSSNIKGENNEDKIQVKKDSYLKVTNYSAKWNKNGEYALENISFEVKSGEMLGLIGPVGSGKTSLLQGLLKELPATSGSVEVEGLVAYASQEPWIFMGTVRDNILFGREFDPSFYSQVVEACALKSDFEQFPQGDLTWNVDDRSLSGGQRARIALSRAVYSNADIYLLDDIISAVDAKVANHIFEKVICGVLKDKVVVFVSHQHQFLRSATKIICLNSRGQCEAQGTYQEIQDSEVGSLLLSSANHNSKNGGQTEAPTEEKDESYENKSDHEHETIPKAEQHNGTAHFNSEEVTINVEQQTGNAKKKGRKEDEALEKSDIGFNLYWTYVKSGSSYFTLFLVVASNLIAQILFTGSDYWLKFWTKSLTPSNSPIPSKLSGSTETSFWKQLESDRNLQMGIYSGIIGALLVFSFLRTSLFFGVCMKASINLHNKLFNSILYTKLQFFQKNPTGRILNRFSKDIGTMDDTLPVVLFDTVEVALQVLGILIVVMLVNVTLTVPAVFVCLSFFFIRRLYLRSAQTIKRLEGIARSPILSHLSSTMNGLTTIRAFKAELQSEEEFYKYLDLHSSKWYLFLASTRWLGVTVDWVSILYILSVTVVVMVTNSGDAEAGLAITSAMSLTGLMQWGVKQSSETASQMISVERVLEYSNLQPEEKSRRKSLVSVTSTSNSIKSKEWITKGRIEFQDVSLKYDETDSLVLKHLKFIIQAGHKIGIVGRTGAGKSSLISALLRLEEPTGAILIDGTDHQTVTLQSLRENVSIIPQTPMLFSDTLRRNLDPVGIYSDQELNSVLSDIQLNSLANGLDTQVEEDGLNFSGGQRQLICLGRALLRRSKILILDESTASMDFETENFIQETIRSKFAESTVLYVAHRLQTVLNTDRILVLDSGNIQEYDEPKNLLQNENSALAILLKHSNNLK